MPERPRVATLLNSLANYNVAIPSVAEDHKVIPKVSFFTFFCLIIFWGGNKNSLIFSVFLFLLPEVDHSKCIICNVFCIHIYIYIFLDQEIKIYFLLISESQSRYGRWCVFAMHSKYIGCHFLHPFRMDCRNSWCTNGFPYSVFILCCCKYNYFLNHL